MIDFRLYVITNRNLCAASSLTGVVEAACRAGVRTVQLREKDLAAGAVFNLAADLVKITRRTGARLLVNDRVDIALGLKADGVHCPEHGFPPSQARRLMGEETLIGASTHSLQSAQRARDEGADFVLFGPVFATPSKADHGDPQGLSALEDVSAAVDIPVFAVGGITPQRATLCLDHGAFGVAVVSAIMSAEDIGHVVEEFEVSLRGL